MSVFSGLLMPIHCSVLTCFDQFRGCQQSSSNVKDCPLNCSAEWNSVGRKCGFEGKRRHTVKLQYHHLATVTTFDKVKTVFISKITTHSRRDSGVNFDIPEFKRARVMP